MNERLTEIERRFADVFLSKYKPDDNRFNKEPILIPISKIMQMLEEYGDPMYIEIFEVNIFMSRNRFDFVRKDGELWFYVKEIKKGLKQDPSSDFY